MGRLTPGSAVVLGLVQLVPSAGRSPQEMPPMVSQVVADNGPQKKGARENDFLLFGTVFTEQGFALRGAEIRVRRTGERKVRGEARSDRRGEFAVRLPRGVEYDVSIEAAGYQGQTRKIDARTGSREDIVFRLQPTPGGKSK